MNGEEAEWLGRQEVDGTYTEGIAFILLDARGPVGRDAWDKELGDRKAHCCLHHVKPALPAPNPASRRYLLGPKLQCLLPGFLKVFHLSDVGLRSRSRGPTSQGAERRG